MNEISANVIFTKEDIDKIRLVYPLVNLGVSLQTLVDDKVMVKIGDLDNLVDLYTDFISEYSEYGINITFDEYISELELGYGESDYLEIARLIVLSNGIWYDNEYC